MARPSIKPRWYLRPREVVDRLRQLGGGPAAESKGIAEKVVFPLPKGLS
jgi:hypothetical protein